MAEAQAEGSLSTTKFPLPNSLRGVMQALNPEWDLEEWFHWPPDLFALTSLLLKTTGAYRFTVSPLKTWPRRKRWEKDARDAARGWWIWIAGGPTLPPLIAENKDLLAQFRDTVHIENIRSLCRNGIREPIDEHSWSICRALLELHAIADEACRGFGLPHAEPDSNRSAMSYLANMLLISTGSLSRLAQYKVMVLPKMRTPQVGLTLRSLSHHVTVHQSEVEVVWRTMPWINSDEETINIMIVPWPRKFQQTWVKPELHSVHRNSSEPARFFAIKRGQDERLPVDGILAMLDRSHSKVNRIHIIVLPELALDRTELDDLKSALAGEMDRNNMPMIITGLREESKGMELGRNKVVLSTFFAGKWYDLEQDKHHRWKLDSSQIQQYNLGGVLSSAREWWEAIEIPDRRLTFLSPNGWLTLCPLICEDLGRLEPVSELIRGVGPTLLIAILLDGPQLRQRWPGRYASVFADDPGTAVLTLSSLGMVECSIPPLGQLKVNRTVALWKDQINGWREIQIGEEEDAKVLTITANWKQEYAADGRGDGGMSAVFSLQGEHALSAKDSERAKRGMVVTGEPVDLRELSTFTFLADAALDVDHSIIDNLERWALGSKHTTADWLDQGFRPKDTLWEAITKSNDSNYNISDEKKHEFKPFVSELADLARSAQPIEPGPDSDPVPYWENLVRKAEEALRAARYSPTKLPNDDDPSDPLVLRVKIYSALAILWAVHKRVADNRRANGLTSQTEDLLNYIEQLLPRNYDDEWHKALATRQGQK
jgi:hypothetical protein